jgi:hypothetical protein
MVRRRGLRHQQKWHTQGQDIKGAEGESWEQPEATEEHVLVGGDDDDDDAMIEVRNKYTFPSSSLGNPSPKEMKENARGRQ